MHPRGQRGFARVGAFLLSLIVGFCVVAAPGYGARSLTRAFTDDVWFDGVGPQWVPRTVATGSHLVLLEIDWASVEPTAPRSGVDPTNPNGPQYNFGYVDAVLREFAGTGIQAAFLVTDAPTWAEAPGGPAQFEADGSWRPNATAFGQLAAALARRYSGSFPDPLYPGQTLPRVRYYQAWGEANFSIHLAPQWVLSHGSWAATGPAIYRSMLNAFYTGIKSVRSDDVVITTGFGPYGDPPGSCSGDDGVGVGCRMPPALFARDLLCLQGSGLRPAPCADPAHFDAMAMDPYQVSSPTTPAVNVNDISSPDLGKLTRAINKAVKTGRALPRRHKQLWVTEFSYDSNPPNPGGVSLTTQARWLEESFYLFWKQGVNTVVWYLLRDQAATYDPSDYFSGVYFYNGTPKPSFEAYRFPLVVMPSGRSATVWGISPRTGTVAVEHHAGRSWKTLFRIRESAGAVFVRNISASLRGNFRAVIGGETSLTWRR